MEKGSSKSSGILIIFYEVMKLQSFECEVSASSSRLYITFHPWWFGPTKWRSYEIASVRLSVFLWNRSSKFPGFFYVKLGCHLNLKSDGAGFFPIVPFPRVFEPKGPKTGIFSFYENWTCVFFKKILLEVTTTLLSFWEKSCFKGPKWGISRFMENWHSEFFWFFLQSYNIIQA